MRIAHWSGITLSDLRHRSLHPPSFHLKQLCEPVHFPKGESVFVHYLIASRILNDSVNSHSEPKACRNREHEIAHFTGKKTSRSFRCSLFLTFALEDKQCPAAAVVDIVAKLLFGCEECERGDSYPASRPRPAPTGGPVHFPVSKKFLR